MPEEPNAAVEVEHSTPTVTRSEKQDTANNSPGG